ncbi:hypothetical protein [Clostridium polynesiense]|uniref:hypothetical protein n=1 Tax=Clostridium polynesiense TaxID=1325933 RepID=UPI00058C1E95|nr:hypothetical protein [Clostridium polynesiense]
MKDNKPILVIKIIIALLFLLSIGTMFFIALDFRTLNLDVTLRGVDIINLPDKAREASQTIRLANLVIPNFQSTLQSLLENMRLIVIVIMVISLISAIATILVRKRFGFIVSISGAAINLALLASVILKFNSTFKSFKSSIEASLGKLLQLIPGFNITGAVNVNLKEILGIGIILWCIIHAVILLLSTAGLFIDSKTSN